MVKRLQLRLKVLVTHTLYKIATATLRTKHMLNVITIMQHDADKKA